MLKVSAIIQLIDTHHKPTLLLIRKEKTICGVVISTSAHDTLLSFLYIPLDYVMRPGCLSPHDVPSALPTNTLIGGCSAQLILGIFRSASGCYVEEGLRRQERGEGVKEQMMMMMMMASWHLIVCDFP